MGKRFPLRLSTIDFHFREPYTNIYTLIFIKFRMAEAEKAVAASPNRTNALLAWIFAPITSFLFMNDEDEFTKKCAKHSLYFGVADIIIQVVLWGGGTVLSFVVIGVCCFPLAGLWGLVSLAVRIIGAVKANQGELFEVPVISGMVKE